MNTYKEKNIPLYIAEKYVSKYETCRSCSIEDDEFGYYPLQAEFSKEGVIYYFDHCCNFPASELNIETWEKIIRKYNVQ